MKLPVICSFYTTEYKELAGQMKQSVESFGFETDIVQIEKINGRWLDTIYWRADFVKMMLEKHKNDVVWLDADAVMCKRPTIFENFKGDFGAHVRDFRWRKNELLGGTMYFADTDKTRKFVDEWIFLNNNTPKQRLSQWVIPTALKRVPLEFVNLPASYCQIFDLMKECGEPTILHTQASRKFRDG